MYNAQLSPTPENIDELRSALPALTGDGNLCHGQTADEIRGDNNLRASWAARALLHYADITMSGGDGEFCETALSDLLSDLMHLTDALDLQFADLVERGRRHYMAELTGKL